MTAVRRAPPATAVAATLVAALAVLPLAYLVLRASEVGLGAAFDLVLTSPMARARETARLAGFPDAQTEPDIGEWDYGEYEGITTPQIRESAPAWTVWSHPTPGGESAEQVCRRLDRVIITVRAASGRVLVFGHGHSLRALTARWLEQPVVEGRHYKLDTGTVCVLGYERETPVIASWNG